MAVSTTDTYSGPYEANGVTVAFPFTFKAVSADDVAVFIRDVAGSDQLVEPSAYNVTLSDQGGSAIFETAPTAGDVYVVSEPSFLQSVIFASGQAFLPGVVNEVNDRDVVRALYLKREIDRAPRTPIGGGENGRFPVVLPDGSWGFSDGTGADSGLRTDLAAPTGAQLSAYRRPGLGVFGAIRSQEDKNSDVFDIRDYDDIDLTGTHDNAATLQKAFDQAVADKLALNIPGGMLIVDSSIQVPTGFTMRGISRSAKGAASRLIFAEEAQLIHGDGVGDYEEGFLYRDIVVGNIQPAVPGSGSWDAVDAVPIFIMNGAAQLDLQNVLFYGATRGVHMAGGGSIGRLNMESCGGQAFVYGVNIDLCADVPKFSNVHWWPFFSDTKPVNNFSCANLDAFYLKRVDTPIFSNVSAIAARSGFRFGNNAYGKTTKALITNAGLDYSTTNIWFDDTSEGTYAWFDNLAMQANNSNGGLANVDGVAVRRNIRMEGVNCSLGINGCDLGGASGSAVEIKGTSNELTLSGFTYVHDYGGEGGAETCFDVDNGSRLFVTGRMRVDAPGAGALTNDTKGRVDGLRRSYTPSVSSQGGALTSVTIAEAKYVRQGNQVSGTVTVVITNAGTATGYVRIGAPVAIDHTFTASATNISTSQNLSVAGIIGNPGSLQLTKQGGGNAAVTGETLSVSFSYEVANG